MAWILSIDLEGRPLRRPLAAETTVVGSGPGCDIQISHPSVSRRHLRLTQRDGSVAAEDLGSSNGSRVGGSKLRAPTALKAGQVLQLGSVEVRLEEAPDGDLEAGVRLASEVGSRPTREGTHQSTAALAPAQGFLVGEIPPLLERMAGGLDRLGAAQALGAALFRSLSCLAVRIEEKTAGLLFEGRREATSPRADTLEIAADRQDVRVAVTFFQSGVARACQGVVECAASLLALSGSRDQRGLSRTASPRSQPPPLPPPASLDRRVQEIYAQAARVAPGKIGVLIRGESGTGKEVLARYVHEASGLAGPLVTLNCAALPDDLLESELFGIERGVATGVDARPGKFEAAHGGTLFLDEIGDMAPATQAKILRVLQEGEVYRLGGREPRPAEARILAATHQPLEEMLAAGSFRSDLYHRIAGWEVTVPPLRERRVDIANLAITFLAAEAEALGIRPAGISRAALDRLEAFRWPGNIRQLRTEIARAALFLSDGELLGTQALSRRLAASATEAPAGSLKEVLESAERNAISAALFRTDASVTEAAAALDLAVSTLYRRMKALGIRRDP
ncbi:MAG: sigma 54-interacting transcriptional regulator [Acidobacteriota bacterium]